MKKKIFIGTLVIIAFIGYLFLTTRGTASINVLSSDPKNGSRFVDTKKEILVNLNRNISLKEGEDLKVKIFPEEKIEKVYQENKIRIRSETEFKTDTKYEIGIYFKEKPIYIFSFTTSEFNQQQIREDGNKQAIADLAFGERYEDFLKNYPWYQSLPIEKNEYRIVYDFEKKSFRIRFKITTSEDQKELIVKTALEDIKKIGVKDPVNYYIIDVEP